MRVHGIDGLVEVNHSHLKIEWKTLRGRLASVNGSPTEIIPFQKIFDALIVPASPTRTGCLQIHLIGLGSSLVRDHNWISEVRNGKLSHVIQFNLTSQSQFVTLRNHIKETIANMRNIEQLWNPGIDLAGGA